MKVTVIARPNSANEKAEVAGDCVLKVWVKSKPINGKANTEITKFLRQIIRKHAGINPRIDIIQGGASATKVVEMDCAWSQVTAAVEAAHQKS